MEWLRVTLIRPLVEFLLLIPGPLRYSALFIVGVLLLAIFPPGLVIRVIGYLGSGLAWIIAAVTQALLSLISGRQSSRLLDRVDASAEWIIERSATMNKGFSALQQFSLRRLPMRRRYLAGAALVPIVLWMARPPLGDIALGQMFDQVAQHLGSMEGWAMNGVYAPLPRSSQKDSEPGTNAPENARPPSVTGGPQVIDATPTSGALTADATHVVQRGESVRTIARQYGVQSRCIMEVNAARYPSQNWDSLQIGQELRIPLSDQDCKG